MRTNITSSTSELVSQITQYILLSGVLRIPIKGPCFIKLDSSSLKQAPAFSGKEFTILLAIRTDSSDSSYRL